MLDVVFDGDVQAYMVVQKHIQALFVPNLLKPEHRKLLNGPFSPSTFVHGFRVG